MAELRRSCSLGDCEVPADPADTTDCTLVGIGGVAGGCPKAAKGGAVPTSCPQACAAAVSRAMGDTAILHCQWLSLAAIP
jgi:hypothetical protein